MELSQEVLKGLALLANSTLLNDDAVKSILSDCVLAISNKSNESDKSLKNNSKGDVIKEVYFCLLTLFVEGIKLQCTDTLITETLSNLNLPESRINQIVKTYETNKTDFTISVLSLNNSKIPHIVDCTWKLDYVLKNNVIEEKELVYRIKFITNDDKDIYFNCSIEQLQDLLFKLKDILYHCEKIAFQKA